MEAVAHSNNLTKLIWFTEQMNGGRQDANLCQVLTQKAFDITEEYNPDKNKKLIPL